MNEKHLLNSAMLVALDTGDYHETQHAIKVLDDEARITDGGNESAAEVAARVLAREVIRLQREERHLMSWRHDVSTALKTGHPSATELMYSQKAVADLRERAVRAEEERDRLRDALAEIEAGSVGWKEDVARQSLGMPNI